MSMSDLKEDTDAKKGLILGLVIVLAAALTIGLSQPGAVKDNRSALPGDAAQTVR